ncbi:MAG: hypothetical protein QNK23_07650 [Crocinitomicaceae bacterium]|nr:hypothetical protein [Crocinitomicaceae bacterium]
MNLILKTVNTVALIIVLGNFSTHAQRLKIDLGVGYGIGLTSTYLTTGSSETNLDTGVQTVDLISEGFNLNQGLTGHLKFNYMLNQEIFLVAGARYQNGRREYAPYSFGYTGNISLIQELKRADEFEQLDVQIGLGIEKKLSDRWSVYFSHGFTFFVYGKFTSNRSTTQSGNSGPNFSREIETVYRPQFTFGAYGDVGVVYKLSDHFNVFFNATVQSKNWSTKNSQITRFTVDGVDQLPTYSVSQLETVYSSTVESSSSTPVDPDKPSASNQTWMPNSGVEAVLGVRVSFGDEQKEGKKLKEREAGLYLVGTFGYGMPMSELTRTSTVLDVNSVTMESTSSSESKLYSYGKGFSGQLLLGYRIGHGFSAEIGGVFNQSESSASSLVTYSTNGNVNTETAVDYTYSAWMIRNTYGLKLESQFKRINAFVRTGLSLGFAGLTQSSEETWTGLFPNPVTEVTQRKYEYSGNVSLGAYIGLGSSVRLSQRFDLVAEAVTYIQNWSPRKREFVVHTVDGVDQLSGATTYSTEVEYVSEINETSADLNPDSPRQALRIAEPFSSFMITVGIRFNFIRKK